MSGPDTAAKTPWSLEDIKKTFATKVTSEDDRLVRIADGVATLLEKETGRYFVSRARTEIQNGSGSNRMWLEKFPLLSLTSVTIMRYPTEAVATMLATDYNVNLVDGCVWAHNDVFQRGNANVTFVYAPGVGAKSGDDLKGHDVWSLGLDLIRIMFDEERTGAKGSTGVNIGAMQYFVKPSWPDHIKMAIRNLKAPRI